MADPRTFVLIGNFEDNITPSLEKINTSIANLKKTFSGLSTRRGGGYDDITKSVGSLVSSQKHLANAVKEVREEVSKSIPYLAEYRKEVGKAAAANFAFARSTGQAARNESNLWRQAIREAEAYKRMANSAAAASRSVGSSQRRGGTVMPPPYDPPRGGGERGVYDGRNRGSVARDATFAFGQTLGYQLSNTITGSIVQGFQIGVGLMVKPFQYFLDGFAERVKDESTDVQTAGAMFAIAQRKNMNMFENFNQAIRAQQQINYKLAESAAALPGATTEYVQMGKRVLDSMMTVLSKDVKGVSAFAQELDPNLKEGDKQGALATLTQKFTEKAVLLGQGSTYRGNYGVPQLLEQLIGSEKVSESMFNKFAMYRDLPIFQSVFKDMQGELAKTGAYSAERIRKVFQLLDEALPNEVLQAHKNTMSGFLEAMRSAFLDPEVGLFGLGRKIQGMEMAMVDQYGNFVDQQGNIVESWDKAAKEQISLYESIQKILTGFGLPLSELASYLPQLFEPFAKLITPLESMFKVAQGFYRNFNIYTKEFENLAKGLSDMGDKKGAATMKKSAGARGTLLAISNLLTAFGDMSGAKFKDISTKLQDPSADIAAISKEVMTSVFNSKFIEELGFQIGMLVGGVLSTVAELLGFARGAGDTRIVAGLKAGFEAAGGTQAFKDIFTNLFQLIFKVMKGIFMMAPAQITALVGASLMLPALMAGISVAIGNLIENLVDASLDEITRFKPKGKTTYTRPIGPLPAPAVTPSQRLAGKTRNTGPAYMGSEVKPRTGFKSSVKGFLKGAVGAGDEFKSVFGDRFIRGAKGAKDLATRGARGAKNLLSGETSFRAFAKGLPVKIVSVAKNATSAVKGEGLAGLLSGAKGAAGGLKGLFGKGMTGLGKVGGIATVGVGIVEAIMALLTGDSLGQALGKGAGPIIGTIIGTALLGPLGGFIGGWIGSMKPVTDTLGGLFEGLIWGFQMLGETLGPALEAFGGVVSSIVGIFVGMIPGMDSAAGSLDLLNIAFIGAKLALFPFISAINGVAAVLLLLKIGILKLDKWINEKFQFGDRQGRLQNEIDKTWAQLGKVAETQKKINDDLLKPLADKNKEKEGYLTKNGVKGWQDAQGNWTAGGKPPATFKPSAPAQPATKPIYSTPGKPGFITVEGKTFWRGTDGTLTTVVGGVAPKGTPYRTQAEKMLEDYKRKKEEKEGGSKEADKTAQNTTDLNKKATDQIKKVAEVKTSTDRTTQAVNNLAIKITPQTNLQTTTAAIYNLLASGQLRVKGGLGSGVYGNKGNPDLGDLPFDPSQTDPNKPSRIFTWAKGGLGDAVASEMKNKPRNSDLVIANSSETVIPAAGGYGMVDFVDTLKWGFATMISTFKQAQQKQDQMLSSINQTLKANQQQTNMRLLAMEKKFATPGMPGGLGGGAAGGVDAFTPIAQSMGLQMTSGYRPGDPGWHGANRARDFSNGTGPTPQMMQFAQLLASNYGSNLKELIYTPLGFSIKNGQQVPPYAQSSHYNHVHVAYATGFPSFGFASEREALAWEQKATLGSTKVASITAREGEFGGGGNQIGSINVTVNAGNISDPDMLADVVAQRILSEMQSDSIFV